MDRSNRPPGGSGRASEGAARDRDTLRPGAGAKPVPVVGIGASAGGLRALKLFLSAVPHDSGLAYVVVVHLSPEHESHLADLLQAASGMPVEQVNEDTVLEANRVYVIPPNANLNTIDTHLRLSDLEENRAERATIDHFFRTLARAHDGKAMGVILSGTGSDGTLGLRVIKEEGGLTVAQDPSEAEYDGMPRNAIASGVVDLVLPAGEMPEALIRFARTEPKIPPFFAGDREPADESEMKEKAEAPERLLHQIFSRIRAVTGRDFSHYKRTTLMRRIRRRMQIHNMEELRAYLEFIQGREDEARQLADDLLIIVTQFFRDTAAFDLLTSKVIPRLFEGRGPEHSVRIWSVGCSTGEEAYSLGILLLEEASRRENPPQVQVFGSDLHGAALKKAREGLFPETIQGDLSPTRLQRFFTREANGYQVRKNLRERIVFAPHDLLRDPPFAHIDLISCRNLMIYLDRNAQRDALTLFHYALNPGGYLMLGTSETVERSHLFAPESKEHALYRRRKAPVQELPLPLPRPPFPAGRPDGASPAGRPDGASPAGVPRLTRHPHGETHRDLVERYGPPTALVSEDFQVVHSSRGAGRFLRLPGGEATHGVLKLVLEPLRIELRAVLHAARESAETVKSMPIAVALDGKPRSVVLRARKVAGEDPASEFFYLVIFDEMGPAEENEVPVVSPGSEATIRDLEGELSLTKDRLRTAVEEYETSQEEMQTSLEELQSTNEELRSTLEELETSKEELQSVNEELTTVNQENRHRVEELSQLTADLQNLLAATDIATLFLDRELHIVRFTPQVSELFNIRHSDQGRPLGDLTHRLGYDELQEDARKVLQRLVPVEREVKSREGRSYLTRILPYRTADDRIEGVVITFIDITKLLWTEDALRRSEESYRVLFDSLDEGFCVMEVLFDETGRAEDCRFLEANAAFAVQMGIPGAVDHRLRELAPPLEESWYEAYGRVATSGKPARFQMTAESLERILDVYAFRVGEPEKRRVAALVRDITSQKEAESRLRDARDELEGRVMERTAELEEQAVRLRGLARELSSTEQRERRRLAGILHDDLQQWLVAAKLRLAALSPDRLDPSVAGIPGEASTMIDLAVACARDLAQELEPPVLYEEGLVPALRWLGEEMSRRYRLAVTVSGDGDGPRPSEEILGFLYQSTRELLFNVVKHAGVHEAEVRVEVAGPGLRILVGDRGKGFDPGSQAPRSPESGIGLHTLRERVYGLDGRMVIDTRRGAGTRVTIEMPVPPEPAPEERPRRRGGAGRRPSSGSGTPERRVRVLVVDDHTVVRQGITSLLGEDPRLEVISEAGDGLEAIASIRKSRPDVVLLDVNMPQMNGVEAARQIRRDWPGIAVIGISAQADDAVGRTMLEAGATAFLPKSAGVDRMIAVVLQAASDGEQPAPA